MVRPEERAQKIKEVIESTQDEKEQIDQIAKIRQWTRPQDDSRYYNVVQKYLTGDINIDEASSKLFGHIDEAIIASKLDDIDFQDLWFSIIHSARRVSFRQKEIHDQIVDLVAAFKNHSIRDNEEYNYLYNSMTDFGMACRESYNDSPQPDQGYFDVEVDAWANVNYFFARVADAKLENLSLYGIWATRQALETEPKDEPNATALQYYDAFTPAAACWIFGAGASVFRIEKDLTPADRTQGNPARGGELWKGKSEFSKERWAFWKDRFAAIGKTDGTSERTRTVARDAVQHMERSETYERI